MHVYMYSVCIRFLYRFSRKIIWLKVGTTNNKPSVIANYYINSVLHLKGFSILNVY